LSCSTPTQPACASWGFESGTEGWTIDTQSGVTAALRQDSTHATVGSHALAIDLTFPALSSGGSVRIVAPPLCPGGGKGDFTGKNIQYSALLVNTSGSPSTFSSASGVPVTIDGGTVTCDPNGIGFAPNNWATDVEQCGALSAPTLGITFNVSLDTSSGFTGMFTATFYVDDVQIK
jgi:hypothetical protein